MATNFDERGFNQLLPRAKTPQKTKDTSFLPPPQNNNNKFLPTTTTKIVFQTADDPEKKD